MARRAVATDASALQRWGGILAEETVAVAARVGDAVVEVQGEIFDAAKQDVPVRTGRLQNSIRQTGRSPLRRRVRAGGAKTFYGAFQEFGTVHHAAKPFLLHHADIDRFEKSIATAVFQGRIYR